MAFGLDAIDRRILALLVEDGRIPAAEMARRVGDVSERSVRYRIDRLQRLGVVRVTAIVNPLPLGYTTIGDVIIDVAPGSLQDVAAQLVDLDQVSYVAGSVGDGDLAVQVYARDPEELVRLVNETIGAIPGVTRARTNIVAWKLKEICDWHVPAEVAEKGVAMV
jgi:Lrp/AsnC family transcriptional regulator, regulator for asnA, asnC and gidA